MFLYAYKLVCYVEVTTETLASDLRSKFLRGNLIVQSTLHMCRDDVNPLDVGLEQADLPHLMYLAGWLATLEAL